MCLARFCLSILKVGFYSYKYSDEDGKNLVGGLFSLRWASSLCLTYVFMLFYSFRSLDFFNSLIFCLASFCG